MNFRNRIFKRCSLPRLCNFELLVVIMKHSGLFLWTLIQGNFKISQLLCNFHSRGTAFFLDFNWVFVVLKSLVKVACQSLLTYLSLHHVLLNLRLKLWLLENYLRSILIETCRLNLVHWKSPVIVLKHLRFLHIELESYSSYLKRRWVTRRQLLSRIQQWWSMNF